MRPENRLKTLCATAVGNLAQLLVLIGGGFIGGAFFAARVLHWPDSRMAALCAVAGLAGLAGLYVYFNMRRLSGLPARIPWIGRRPSILDGIRTAAETDRRTLLRVLAWAFARYAVYTLQYLLLLYFFGIETGFAAGLAGIASIYLLQTVVPLPALAGLAVRGGLAVFMWSYFGANTIASLAASFVLWIINLILPALLGTFSLLSVHITKLTGYDDA